MRSTEGSKQLLIFRWLLGGGVGWQSKKYVVGIWNIAKISWVSQAKMVSKCNRIASSVIFNYKIFMVEVPLSPLTRWGLTPLSCSPPPPSPPSLVPLALGEHRRRLMAIPLSKSRRRPCYVCSKELSHWGGSFEHTQHMFWLRNKKNNFSVRTDRPVMAIAVYWGFKQQNNILTKLPTYSLIFHRNFLHWNCIITVIILKTFQWVIAMNSIFFKKWRGKGFYLGVYPSLPIHRSAIILVKNGKRPVCSV